MAPPRPAERLPVGSTQWIAEERSSALKIAQEETEDFAFCARNEAEWLNEHVAEIFSENHFTVKDIFKTPGKLRGKTPYTAKKRNPLEPRAPLTDVFSATPRGEPSPFKQPHFERPTPKFQVAQDPVLPSTEAVQIPQAIPTVATGSKIFHDSGYHGSQSVMGEAHQDTMEIDDTLPLSQPVPHSSPPQPPVSQEPEIQDPMEIDEPEDERTGHESFQSANEEQPPAAVDEQSEPVEDAPRSPSLPPPAKHIESSPPKQDANSVPVSPKKDSPEKPAVQQEAEKPAPQDAPASSHEERPVSGEDVTFDDVQSGSDGSSPIRPIVRKSSLSFASLPAREPLTTKQSIGNRVSRTSHLDQTRQSYFGRPTGGKSLGNLAQINNQQEAKKDEASKMDLDVEPVVQKADPPKDDAETNMLQLHSKTSTQRLQDQISKLGQSQSNAHRPSKSIPNAAISSAQPLYPSIAHQDQEEPSSARKPRPTVLPGSFPDDEEDSWIGAPQASATGPAKANERPLLAKAYTTNMIESAHTIATLGQPDFMVSKDRENELQEGSPTRAPFVPERNTSTLVHTKSASTTQLASPKKGTEETAGHKKGISVSNPSLAAAQDSTTQANDQPVSPTRSYRDSPIKASKEKLSSILKFSKSLFASGAALSAEAKRNASQPTQDEHLLTKTATDQSLYPNLEKAAEEAAPPSPTRPGTGRKTRASTEREEKRKEKEAKEAQRMVAQLDKLEKAREKEKEKARVFSQEKEKIAAAQKQAAAQQEQEKLAKASQVEIPRSTRTSPRKTKAQLEAEGRAAAALSAAEIEDANEPAVSMPPPPSIPRPVSQIGKPKEMPKRPGRPLKDPQSKTKQTPMIIRVDTGSQRNQHHPSNSTLAASLQASLAPSTAPSSQTGLKSKATNPPTLSTKASTSSFSSSISSTGPSRPRALDSAARKKEQDEREAQRKRDIKLENERKLEEKRQEQRRKEAERQQLEAKKASQAARLAHTKRKEVEMAKQHRPPPPPARHQQAEQEKPLPPVPQPQRMNQAAPRPASRIDPARPLDDMSRPMNLGFQNIAKAPPKRPLQQDSTDELAPRPTLQRNGPSYQQNDGKRRRTGEEFQESELPSESQHRQMAPPIRQSGVRPKDGPTKSLFTSGYAHGPQGSHAGPSLHKATLQHLHQSKPAHPMDMAQVSKASIPFASSTQSTAGSSYKTPGRPGNSAAKSAAKSNAKSSPRYQNGEDINLPEIHTDSEDEDEDGDNDFSVPDWADSPALRDQLAAQDSMDPAEVFGPVPELKMEEMFKNKERWNRFRARTSSANWSGQDRLTEDEIRKDLEGRERLRREGGWTYGMS